MARSKKEVSNIVSGAGLLTRIFTDLDKQVRELGGTDEDWHRLTTPDGADIIKAMAEAMVNHPPGRIIGEWIRSFNYGRPLGEVIFASNYATVTDKLREFRIEGSGQVDFEVVLFKPQEASSTAAVIEQMLKRGLSPAGAAELLAFGEGIDDEFFLEEYLGDKYEIAALGAHIPGPVLRCKILCVSGDVNEKHLYTVTDFPDAWGSYWFLAVRLHTDGNAARRIQEIEREQ